MGFTLSLESHDDILKSNSRYLYIYIFRFIFLIGENLGFLTKTGKALPEVVKLQHAVMILTKNAILNHIMQTNFPPFQ